MSQQKCPLNDDLVTVLEDNLEWDKFIWGNKQISVNGKKYGEMRCFKYLKREKVS